MRQPLNETVYPVTQGDEAIFGNRRILSRVCSPDLICVKFLREVEHWIFLLLMFLEDEGDNGQREIIDGDLHTILHTKIEYNGGN